MNERRLKKLLKKLVIAEDVLKSEFSEYADKCSHREEVLHGRDPWYRCSHKGYHLSSYTDITPCNFKYCPMIK
jgi:hypothetical protein